MPILSNGSELTVWEQSEFPLPSPDAIVFSIAETDGDVIGPVGAKPYSPYVWSDLVQVDVFDGFFTISSFTHEARSQTVTFVETRLFDNEGNFIRTLTDGAAFLSAEFVSITAQSPDDVTLTWFGANEYFGGENTRYGQHQLILDDGVLQPDTFVNHDPVVADLDLTLSQGESFVDFAFKANDPDYDLLSFTVLDGPDHGAFGQFTRFEGNFYPFYQGSYAGSLHYHEDFLSGNLFNYTPDAGFTGTDTFTVVATDGQGNSNVATITITVTPPAQSLTLSDARNVASYGGHDRAVLVAALGGDDRIDGTPYNDTLDGGAGHDQLLGGAGADHLIGAAGTDWLKGGDGHDWIEGGAGTDGLRGDAGDDRLDGGGGTDDVQGGAGDDTVNGGAGRDSLIGGTGRDVFAFNALGPANYDVIADFGVLDDAIALDSSVFVGLSMGPLNIGDFLVGTHAGQYDRILYNQATGELFFDADSWGAAAPVKFATVTPGTVLTAADFIVV